MASTYTLISSQVLASSAASVTFSSIPATYTDLVLRMSVKNSTTYDSSGVLLTFNGSGINSFTTLYGTVTTAYSDRYNYSFAQSPGSGVTANTFASIEISIPNYNSTSNKQMSSFYATENNSSSVYYIGVGASKSTYGSITSITLTDGNAANFVTNSSFYLYGISNA